MYLLLSGLGICKAAKPATGLSEEWDSRVKHGNDRLSEGSGWSDSETWNSPTSSGSLRMPELGAPYYFTLFLLSYILLTSPIFTTKIGEKEVS